MDPCFLWMWQERGLAPTPSWQIWGWVGDSSPQDIWDGRGCRHSGELQFPFGFPWGRAQRHLVLPPGIPWSPVGLPTFPGLEDPGLELSLAPVLAGVKQIRSCRNWDWAGAAASDSLSLGDSRDGGWSFLTRCCF